jgi:hypothetical protein
MKCETFQIPVVYKITLYFLCQIVLSEHPALYATMTYTAQPGRPEHNMANCVPSNEANMQILVTLFNCLYLRVCNFMYIDYEYAYKLSMKYCMEVGNYEIFRRAKGYV